MKRILTNNIQENVRRMPFSKVSLDHLQESYREVIAAILKNFTEDDAGFYRLFGLVDQDAGADYDISAGAVYYNGEVYLVDAFAAEAVGGQVPVLTITETFHEDDPVTFSDNNPFSVHQIKKMVISLGASGSGDVDFSALQDIGFPLKANKEQSEWVDITLINGWTAFGGDTPQYRIDEFGKKHLRGRIANLGGNWRFSNELPSAVTDCYTVKPYAAGGGGVFLGYCYVLITETGSGFVNKAPDWSDLDDVSASLSLHGISYW